MGKKIMQLLSVTAFVISIIFSVKFTFSQNMLFGFVFLTLEISKICLINYLNLVNKLQYKIIVYFICFLASFFSILSIVATSYNELETSKQSEIKTIKNDEYDVYLSKKGSLESEIARLDKELQNYPTLDQYRGNIPSWLADKRVEITKEYELNKQKIVDQRLICTDQLNKLTIPLKTKQVKEPTNKGYNNIFNKLKLENVELLFSIVFGCILELLIYSMVIISKNIDIEKKELAYGLAGVSRELTENENGLTGVSRELAENVLTQDGVSRELTESMLTPSTLTESIDVEVLDEEVSRELADGLAGVNTLVQIGSDGLAENVLTQDGVNMSICTNLEIVNTLSANYKKGDIVTGLMVQFGMTRYQYSKLVKYLKDENVVEAKGTKLIYIKNN